MGNDKISETIKGLNKKYGENSVIKVSEETRVGIESVSSGSFSLDEVFGCGGIPRGRMIEIFGVQSSGKSTLALFLVAQMQANGLKAVWIDAEHCFDQGYSEAIGVKMENLYVAQPSYGEEGLDILREMVRTNEIDIIVVDSVAALTPKKELDAEIIKEDMALQARMMSKAMRVLAGEISESKTIVIFINQIRQKVGVFWGSPNVTPGGNALKFYASVILEVKKGENVVDENKDVIGNWIKMKATKNKVGPPFREATFELIYSKGIDLLGDLLDTAVKRKVVKRGGASYSFGDVKLGVGRENVKEYLKNNEEVRSDIAVALTEQYEQDSGKKIELDTEEDIKEEQADDN